MWVSIHSQKYVCSTMWQIHSPYVNVIVMLSGIQTEFLDHSVVSLTNRKQKNDNFHSICSKWNLNRSLQSFSVTYIRSKVYRGVRCATEGLKCCKFNQRGEQGSLKAARASSTIITNGDLCTDDRTDLKTPRSEGKYEAKLSCNSVYSVIKVNNHTDGKQQTLCVLFPS